MANAGILSLFLMVCFFLSSCALHNNGHTLSRRMFEHKSRTLAVWSEWQKKNIRGKIVPAPDILLDYLRIDNKINGYAKDDILPNMTGTAGSKNLVVTSGQAGFIRELTVAIYAKDYKNNGLKSATTGVGQINISSSVDEIESLAEKAASFIKEVTVSYG